MAVRELFLRVSRIALDLLRSDAIAARWDAPSALEHWAVSGLAGHLTRATTSVDAYLDRGEPSGSETLTAAQYFGKILEHEIDLTSEIHRAVRQRGDAEAAEGREALIQRFSDTIDRLEERLPREPEDRRVETYQSLVLMLDDYLVSRLVELCFHIDDLAVSVDEPVPDLPGEAMDLVIDTCVQIARERHGDLAVVRALGRRERDGVGALRVF